MRWVVAGIATWVICVSGFYLIWLIGLVVNCIFIPDCFCHINSKSLLAAVNEKSVLVRGSLSALVVSAIAWVRREKS